MDSSTKQKKNNKKIALLHELTEASVLRDFGAADLNAKEEGTHANLRVKMYNEKMERLTEELATI